MIRVEEINQRTGADGEQIQVCYRLKSPLKTESEGIIYIDFDGFADWLGAGAGVLFNKGNDIEGVPQYRLPDCRESLYEDCMAWVGHYLNETLGYIDYRDQIKNLVNSPVLDASERTWSEFEELLNAVKLLTEMINPRVPAPKEGKNKMEQIANWAGRYEAIAEFAKEQLNLIVARHTPKNKLKVLKP